MHVDCRRNRLKVAFGLCMDLAVAVHKTIVVNLNKALNDSLSSPKKKYFKKFPEAA